MLTGQCHCGNISFTVEKTPNYLIECNCSICTRYGAQWAQFKPNYVTIHTREHPSKTYRWGRQAIDFHHCPTCGCVTHYTSTGAVPTIHWMSVNARLSPLTLTKDLAIRHFDGAETWTFLD